MSIQEITLYSASALFLLVGLTLIIRARLSRRKKRELRLGWWHADAQTLRGVCFEDMKRHESDNRNY